MGSRSRPSRRRGSSTWPARAACARRHGQIQVTPLGDTVFLGTIPLPDARAAIESSLNRFARVAAYENWLAKAEERALAEAVCVDDRLPAPAPLTLDDLLPFTAPGFR